MLIFESILVYTLLAFLMYKFAQLGEQESRMQPIYNALPIILFTLVFGLRYSVGMDWANYVEDYEQYLADLTIKDFFDSKYEPAFNFVVYICQQLSLPAYGLFFCFSFLQILLIYATLKKVNPSIIKYVYVAFIFTGFAIIDFTNAIRQHLAVCIFMYAMTFVPEKKYIKYWICCFCAYLFHHSALIVFPICFIWIRRSDAFRHPILQSMILLVCFITTFFDILPKILHYTEMFIMLLGYDNYIGGVTELTFDTSHGISRIIEFLALILIVFFSNKIKKHFQSDAFNMMYDLFFIGICCKYLFLSSMMFRRIALYFIDYYFIVYGFALSYFAAIYKKQARDLACAAYVYIAFLMLYAKQIIYCESSTGAYVTIFQKDLHDLKDDQRETILSNMN